LKQASNKLITIIGGSGFVGRHLVQTLAKQGYRIRIGVRRPDLTGHLQPLGGVGQIMPVQVNVRFPDSIESACQDADVVINLTGILAQSGAQTFEAVHQFGAKAVALAAAQVGAKKLIHMSAIGADENSSSAYGRSKAIGETLVKEAFANATIIRPSIIFGHEDKFFNKIAELARFSMFIPLIGGGSTRFQPVFVGNVAEAIATIVNSDQMTGKIVELGGPQVFSFKELVEFTLKVTERKRILVPLPWAIAKMVGSVLGALPLSLLTRDQVLMLETDNIVSDQAQKQRRTLDGLGIEPEAIAAQVPGYLFRYRKFGQFTETGNSNI